MEKIEPDKLRMSLTVIIPILIVSLYAFFVDKISLVIIIPIATTFVSYFLYLLFIKKDESPDGLYMGSEGVSLHGKNIQKWESLKIESVKHHWFYGTSIVLKNENSGLITLSFNFIAKRPVLKAIRLYVPKDHELYSTVTKLF